MTLVEQSITDSSRARSALVDAITRRVTEVCGTPNDPYHLACRARFADATDYCAEMRAAYVSDDHHEEAARAHEFKGGYCRHCGADDAGSFADLPCESPS